MLGGILRFPAELLRAEELRNENLLDALAKPLEPGDAVEVAWGRLLAQHAVGDADNCVPGWLR